MHGVSHSNNKYMENKVMQTFIFTIYKYYFLTTII